MEYVDTVKLQAGVYLEKRQSESGRLFYCLVTYPDHIVHMIYNEDLLKLAKELLD